MLPDFAGAVETCNKYITWDRTFIRSKYYLMRYGKTRVMSCELQIASFFVTRDI